MLLPDAFIDDADAMFITIDYASHILMPDAIDIAMPPPLC